MVDHVKALGYKFTLPKALVLTITVLFFFWLAPIEDFNILRTLDFESLVFGIWFIIIGLFFTIEGLLSLPETKKATSKAGASILIGLGFVAFAFGAISLIGGIDIIKGSTELLTVTTILLGGASLLFFISLVPEVFKRESFIRQLARQFG